MTPNQMQAVSCSSEQHSSGQSQLPKVISLLPHGRCSHSHDALLTDAKDQSSSANARPFALLNSHDISISSCRLASARPAASIDAFVV